MLALLGWMAVAITIVVVGYISHYRTFLRPKQTKSRQFLDPVPYPEDGEDAAFCDLCHGRIGTSLMASCACGRRFHLECVEASGCPGCGNDAGHMHVRKPVSMPCPICLRPTREGHCKVCGITVPRRDGSFRCEVCGTVLKESLTCRGCGASYRARVTNGYMDRVR